jgi:hypothetical protein
MAASFVLATLRNSTYRKAYASFPHLLRPCWTTILNILQCVEEHEKAKKNLSLVVDFGRATSTKR